MFLYNYGVQSCCQMQILPLIHDWFIEFILGIMISFGDCEDIWGWDLGTVDGLNETIGTYYGIYNKNYRKDHCSQK